MENMEKIPLNKMTKTMQFKVIYKCQELNEPFTIHRTKRKKII